MTLYLRSRRVRAATAVMCVLALGSVLLGGRFISFGPESAPVTMPYRYVLVMLSAATAVGSVASPVPGVDRSDVGPLRNARWVHLGAVLALVLTLSGMAELWTASGSPVAMVRAGIVWFGTALVSRAVAGESLAWVLPTMSLLPILRWGSADGGPAPWNWAAAAAWEPVAWWVAAACLSAGLTLTVMRGDAFRAGYRRGGTTSSSHRVTRAR